MTRTDGRDPRPGIRSFASSRRARFALAAAIVMTTGTSAIAAPTRGPNPNPRAEIACENTAPRPGTPRHCTAPVLALETSGTGLNASNIETLRGALGIDATLDIDDDGAVRYMDQDRFQAVPSISVPIPDFTAGDEEGEAPTEHQIIDVASLLDLNVLDGNVAVLQVASALSQSGLVPSTAGDPVVSHSKFSIEHNPDYLAGLVPVPEASTALGALGRTLPTVPLLETIVGQSFDIDTQVNYPLSFDGVPIVGPGAKVKVSFAPSSDEGAEPEVTQLLYSAVDVAGVGPAVEVIPPELHVQTCITALDVPLDHSVEVTADLVYYAPALASGATALQPHISCASSGTSHEGDEILSRTVLVPAVLDAPKVTLSTEVVGSTVTAAAAVASGTGPYSFDWSSEHAAQSLVAEGSSVSYDLATPGGGPLAEELVVWVTDANGLVGVGRVDLDVQAADGPERTPGPASGDDTFTAQSHGNGPIQFGTEYVGTYNHAADLQTGSNATGFRNRMDDYIPSLFFWGNNNAWERDFRDSSTGGGGSDHTVVDDVDIAFFTGHAGGNGWNLEANQGDNFVHYNDARLGQTDLEWLVIGACGVLQDGSPSFATRWGPAFKGLHMILGYATVSNDTTQEGAQFANYLLNGWKLYQAWGQQAINIQPSSVVYGYGGPVGYNGEWNAHDYLWGKGPVSADVTNVYYIWRTVGNS
ncbi:MAG TPA: DUF6345 domain-containing protein [Acidimicrobiales bacterium]|nr:DUF6345 domain-containing protein [Acidimicrobiales bacterium]